MQPYTAPRGETGGGIIITIFLFFFLKEWRQITRFAPGFCRRPLRFDLSAENGYTSGLPSKRPFSLQCLPCGCKKATIMFATNTAATTKSTRRSVNNPIITTSLSMWVWSLIIFMYVSPLVWSAKEEPVQRTPDESGIWKRFFRSFLFVLWIPPSGSPPFCLEEWPSLLPPPTRTKENLIVSYLWEFSYNSTNVRY